MNPAANYVGSLHPYGLTLLADVEEEIFWSLST
jgi:hypothetical protein